MNLHKYHIGRIPLGRTMVLRTPRISLRPLLARLRTAQRTCKLHPQFLPPTMMILLPASRRSRPTICLPLMLLTTSRC